jgi:hypothetical protein
MNQKYTALVLMAVLAVALLSTFTVLPDLNEKAYASEFRELAYQEKGMKKGFLTDATEEAISMWVEQIKARKKWKIENCVIKVCPSLLYLYNLTLIPL